MEKQFYTYLHCLPTGEPFYIGKGSGRRAYQFNSRNKHHHNITKKYGLENIQIFIFESESEEQAFADEIQQIAQLRKEGYELVNYTNGGEGVSGLKQTEEQKLATSKRMKGKQTRLGAKLSEESKKKIADKATGRKHPLERNVAQSARMKGKPSPATGMKHTEESKAKISRGCSGQKRTEEQCVAQSKRQNGKPHPRGKGFCPHCNTEVDLCHLKRHHLDNCKHKPVPINDN